MTFTSILIGIRCTCDLEYFLKLELDSSSILPISHRISSFVLSISIILIVIVVVFFFSEYCNLAISYRYCFYYWLHYPFCRFKYSSWLCDLDYFYFWNPCRYCFSCRFQYLLIFYPLLLNYLLLSFFWTSFDIVIVMDIFIEIVISSSIIIAVCNYFPYWLKYRDFQ